jgi:hypothetical protein
LLLLLILLLLVLLRGEMVDAAGEIMEAKSDMDGLGLWVGLTLRDEGAGDNGVFLDSEAVSEDEGGGGEK